jgi:hypothetical protein
MENTILNQLSAFPAGYSLPHIGLLHYFLSESDGKTIAHCLDLDLVALGRDHDEAAAKLYSLVKAHIELSLATLQVENLATRAPQSYWDQFANGKRIDLELKTVHIEIPEEVQGVPMLGSELRIVAHSA